MNPFLRSKKHCVKYISFLLWCKIPFLYAKMKLFIRVHQGRYIFMTEKELLAKGYRKYYGTEMDVYFRLDLCIHSAVCVKGNRSVFNVRKRPWILPDGEPEKENLMELIHRCPSGALQYIVHNEMRGGNGNESGTRRE